MLTESPQSFHISGIKPTMSHYHSEGKWKMAATIKGEKLLNSVLPTTQLRSRRWAYFELGLEMFQECHLKVVCGLRTALRALRDISGFDLSSGKLLYNACCIMFTK